MVTIPTTPPSGDKSEGGDRGVLSANVIFNPHILGSGAHAFMLWQNFAERMQVWVDMGN